MNFTLTGILLVIVFVLPGASWAGYYYGEFQTKKHSSTELILVSLNLSLIVHLILLGILFFFYSEFPSGNFFSQFLNEYFQKDLKQLDRLLLGDYVQIFLITIIYVAASMVVAFVASRLHCCFSRLRKGAIARRNVVFQNLFDQTGINYVKITMNDGLVIIGQVKHYPQDYESVHADSKELILTNVSTIQDGLVTDLDEYCTADQQTNVYINTSNIKVLQLIRPSDKHK